MDKKRIHIYDIYFPASGKHYIGQTDNLKRRMFKHLKANSLVGSALRKYDDWQISVLHVARSRDVANTLEIEEIRNFDSVAPNGYNLTHGGEGGTPSDETRKKIGDGNRGKIVSEETCKKQSDAKTGENNPMYGADHSGENNPFYGKNHTEETLKKMSDAMTGEKNPLYGKHLSEETLKKMRDAKTGENHPLYGTHHSAETLKKMRDAQTGKTDTQKLIIRYKKIKTRLKNLELKIDAQ